MKTLILALFLLGSASLATSAHSVCLAWKPGSYTKTVTLCVWRQRNQNGYFKVKQLSNSLTSWTDTNVVAGSQYSYYILACDTKTTDCSAPSNIVSVAVP